MMKRWSLLFRWLVVMSPSVANAQTLYNSAGSAHIHCPGDNVVWLNTAPGIYHFAGERWYGATKHGAYVCEKQADAAGDRATENGQ